MPHLQATVRMTKVGHVKCPPGPWQAVGTPALLVSFCPHHWYPTTKTEYLMTCKGRQVPERADRTQEGRLSGRAGGQGEKRQE